LAGVIDLSSDRALYFVVLTAFVIGFGLIHRVIHSPFGQVLIAIRDNPARATSLGYGVDRFKRIVFTLSAALAGLAGAMKAVLFGVVTLTDVHWHLSGGVVLMALLGGLGTITGPALGACVVVLLENELSDIGAYLARVTGFDGFNALGESVTIVTGLIFIACVLVFRRGIVGEISHHVALRRLRKPQHTPATGEASPSPWVNPPF
jgi:branched-chain amino acid transport system permease protein